MKQAIRIFSALILVLLGNPVLALGAFPQFQDWSSSYVTVRDGHFWQEGQRLYLHGVNYWPRYSLSLYDPKRPSSWWCYDYWISCDYRPQDIESELQQIKAIGMNLIVIHGIDETDATQVSLDNLRDLIARAKRNGLLALLHQSFSYNFNDLPVEKAVEEYGNRVAILNLANETALVGYDIAWELNLGSRSHRRDLNPDWTKWILSKYGSIEVAEARWNYQPYLYGSPSIVGDPEDQQLTSEGPWSKYVTDYWRFVYDWANSYFDPIVRAIKEVDPNHLVTIRNGYGGNGNPWANSVVPPDISVGADFLDFLSPEGYALPPSLDSGYEWQVARLFCGNQTSAKCNQQQRIWDNPSDHNFDFIVIPSQMSRLVDPSEWPHPTFNPAPNSVSGRVIRGDNGQPLVGIQIDTCTDANARTDSNGYFQFAVDAGQGFCVRVKVPDAKQVLAINPSPNLVKDHAQAALAGLGFTTTYVRWATNNTKPVVFLEFGQSTGLLPIFQTLQAQKEFYQYFYEAALSYDVDGLAAWWYPGGPRLDEGSDFGIVNSDNSVRPVADAIRQYASRVGKTASKPIDYYLQIPFGIDDPLGYAGVYTKYLPRFRQLLTQGAKPAVRFQLWMVDLLKQLSEEPHEVHHEEAT